MFWRRTSRRLGTGSEPEAVLNAGALVETGRAGEGCRDGRGFRARARGRAAGAGCDLREAGQGPRTGCPAHRVPPPQLP